MTTPLTLRLVKGSALTWQEADDNFTNLGVTADLALELATTTFTSVSVGVVPAGGTDTSKFLKADGTWGTPAGSGGTVTSIGITTTGATDALVVSGSPVTNSGTISLAVNTFGSTTAGVAPASGGGTSNFLRADGSWAAPTSGTPDATTVLDAQGQAFQFWISGTTGGQSGSSIPAIATQGTVSGLAADAATFYRAWASLVCTDSGNTWGTTFGSFAWSSTAGQNGFDVIQVVSTGSTFPATSGAFIGLSDAVLNVQNPWAKDNQRFFGLATASGNADPNKNTNWWIFHHENNSGVWTSTDTGVAKTTDQVIWQRIWSTPGSGVLNMTAYLVTSFTSVTTLCTAFSASSNIPTADTLIGMVAYGNSASGGGAMRFHKAHGVVYGCGNPF